MIGYLPTADGYECDTLDKAKKCLVECIEDALSLESIGEEVTVLDVGNLTLAANRAIDKLLACTEIPISVQFLGCTYFVGESE